MHAVVLNGLGGDGGDRRASEEGEKVDAQPVAVAFDVSRIALALRSGPVFGGELVGGVPEGGAFREVACLRT